MKKISVLIVDDSALIRQMLKDILSSQPDIEVLDTASDPYEAREKIKKLNPDVLTLDVEMPKMDGLSFLEKIMSLRPTPVVMVSTLTGKGTDVAVAALQIGAIDCIAKPVVHSQQEIDNFALELSEKVRTAAKAKLRATSSNVKSGSTKAHLKPSANAPKLIAIGASTGGVEALTEVLTSLPAECPPIVITQHMPPVFTASFAARLSGICAFKIKEAADRMPIQHGTAYIAPGGKQLKLHCSGTQIICRVTDEPPVQNHKPSVDVLFNSVAHELGNKALGIILTGMGKDGAEGLMHMRKQGAHTIGQDEASCIVYGMPQAASKLGAVAETLPLSSVAAAIIRRSFL
jgi:two-component system, chemotaxis family, protein-glutamate methylesterase/glutaminase